MGKSKPTIYCYCNSCRKLTKHSVVCHHAITQDNPDYDYFKVDYFIVRCDGCDNVQFYMETRDETSWKYNNDGTMDDDPICHTYPYEQPLIEPINRYSLPSSIRGIYTETIDCLNYGNFQLAAAGFRAVIEAGCVEKGVVGKDLNTKIGNLNKKHLITDNDSRNLHTIRFIGNDSIHCLQRYGEKELKIVADVVNTMLTSLFIIQEEVAQLKQKPVTEYEEFLKILDKKVAQQKPGTVGIIRNWVRHDRRILSESLPEFESALIKSIQNGEYKRLSLCKKDKSNPNTKQQYKIEPID